MAFLKKSLQLLSASTQYAEISNGSQSGLNFTTAVTLEAWIAPLTISANMTIIAKGNTSSNTRQYQFFVTSAGELQAHFSDDGGISSGHYVVFKTNAAVISTNRWTHVAVTFNVTTEACVFYVNGQSSANSLIFGSTIGASLYSGAAAFEVGIRSDGGEPANMRFALARAWNVIRSQSEISDNRFLTLGATTGLVSQWTFNGVATDSIGSNNLTLNGGPVYLPDVPFSGVNNSDWTEDQRLFVPQANVSGSIDLTNFVAMLKDGAIPASVYSAMQSGEINASWLMDDTTHLKAYYRFVSGNLTTDTSGNSQTLTNNNTAVAASDFFGNGADLEASSSQYFSRAANLGIAGNVPMSVIGRFKLEQEIASSFYGIFDHTDNATTRYLQLYYDYNSGSRRLVLDNAGTTGTYSVLLSNTPHTFVVTRNSSNQASLWLDGELVISNVSQGSTGGTTKINIGNGNSSAIPLDGVIGDFAFLSRAISVQEILSLTYGGGDLRLTTDSAGVNEIPFERVYVNPSGQDAEIHLRLSTLHYDQDTEIYIWAGNNRATPYERGAVFGQWNTWGDYAAVYHMQGTPEDATVNANNGTNNSITNADYTNANGAINKGVNLDGSADYISIPDAAALDVTGALTLQAFVKPNSPSGDGVIMGKGNFGSAAATVYGMFMTSGRTIGMGVSNGTTYAEGQSAGTITNAAYSLVHGVYIPSTSVTTYLNGVQDGQDTTSVPSAIQSTSATAAVGRDGNNSSRFLKAAVDEVRIRPSALTAAWIATEDTMFGDPENFFESVSLPTVTTTSPATSITSNSAAGSGNVTGDGGGTVTERGIAWGTSPNPTTAGTHQASGSGTGAFGPVAMTSLLTNTHYYFRAYAINAAGTAYGADVEFDTLDAIISGVATLSSVPVENAKITLIDSDTDEVVDTALTDVDGEYEFSGLDVTKLYHVTAEYEDSPDQYNALSLPYMTPAEVW